MERKRAHPGLEETGYIWERAVVAAAAKPWKERDGKEARPPGLEETGY
jgi:hypothetical protein